MRNVGLLRRMNGPGLHVNGVYVSMALKTSKHELTRQGQGVSTFLGLIVLEQGVRHVDFRQLHQTPLLLSLDFGILGLLLRNLVRIGRRQVAERTLICRADGDVVVVGTKKTLPAWFERNVQSDVRGNVRRHELGAGHSWNSPLRVMPNQPPHGGVREGLALVPGLPHLQRRIRVVLVIPSTTLDLLG